MLLVVPCLGSTAAPLAPPPATLAGLLTERLGFSSGQLAALDRGDVVARTLDTSHRREVAAFGAVRIATPREYFVGRYRESVGYRRSRIVPEIGRFGDAPVLSDLDGLTLDAEEVGSLKDCRPGNCKVHLPVEAIEAFRKLDWQQADAADQATLLFKRMLVDLAATYRTRGNRVLPEYADGRVPIRVADELRAIAGDSPYLLEDVPELHRYLDRFPDEPLPGAENFMYWSKERLGLKPVISMTHVVLYPVSGRRVAQTVIASKQIYANHYFEAAQAYTTLIDAEGADGDPQPSFYLAYLHRTRTASLDGFFRSLMRPTINRRVRDGLEEYLTAVKTRLESGWKDARISNLAPASPHTVEPF